MRFILLVGVTLAVCCAYLVRARPIEDCCCEAETVDIGNDQELHDRLQELRAQTFFKTFKVDLHSECPFWHQESVCHRQGCSVCPCEEDQIPDLWKEEEKQAAAAKPKPPPNPWSAAAKAGAKRRSAAPVRRTPSAGDEPMTALVDRTLATDFVGWSESDDTLWIDQSRRSDDGAGPVYVDLLLNPEGYTGYEGKEAHRIWASVYDLNCFRGERQDFCLEQRVLYRLISGLHSAIAAHTAARYDIGPDMVGPSVEVFEQKLGAYPERIDNLYFAFVFLLRAVHKASPLLYDYEYSTGHLTNDLHVKHVMQSLLDSRIVRSCLPEQSFDEGAMFSTPDTKPLKSQFKEHFRNISAIMDCVSCEKCKLHGKLQVLGLGTALRILFSERSLTAPPPGGAAAGAGGVAAGMNLQRNEVIALIVTLAKFSHAIRLIHEFQNAKAWFNTPEVLTALMIAVVALVVLTVALALFLIARRRMRFRVRCCRSRKHSSSSSSRSSSSASSSLKHNAVTASVTGAGAVSNGSSRPKAL